MIYLLAFLLIFSIGIGIILHMAKGMKNFWALVSWTMVGYIFIAFITLMVLENAAARTVGG